MHDPACCPRLQEAQRQWEIERALMKEQILQQCADAKRLNRRFKMLQTACNEQQKVLNRYEETIRAYSMLPPASQARSSSTGKEEHDTSNESKSPLRKRSKVAAPSEATRQSLPVAAEQKPVAAEVKSSPERRRSLSERRSEQAERHATNKASFDSWRARKKDMHSLGGGAIRGSDFLRRHQETLAASMNTEATPARLQAHREEPSTNSDSFLEDGKLSPKHERAKHETGEKRSPPRTLFAAAKRPLPKHQAPFTSSTSARPASSSTGRASENPTGFAYVEVVRNREERAALPAHDCIECRKYYEALDGLVSDSDIKAKCSRHRARFEPYQTPDDFWRLSFPDSPSQDLTSA